ncbi:hypothetical protein C2845_PM15G14780 [Panicum miliaceum]|uniref:Uncharacterized protein n=1 Tax=Panicum miliaceum TaxID=4540 RepID=A0A3L6Q8K0_PANMI|nr:hypothetical protein C2845_PM15G14780 [Panicum miliaceum]
MDAFFSGLDSRLRVSVKAADSIMVGLVNAAMEDAYRKSLWKDGDLDRLFHKLRFAELAIMQLEWCLLFVRGEMEADDGQEQLLDDLLETRDQIQARLDEAELAVAEADRDYMRRKRAELAPARGRETPPAAGLRGAEEECGRAFGELRGSVIQKMSRMRARLEDASSTLAALMEKVSGEASPMARLQEAGHEGEGVKGLSGFYGMAQLLMEFQEMVLDAGVVRDSFASSFDAMERSVSALGAAMDEQQWLMDAEREMYRAVVEGFVREINVGSDRTSSPGEGSRPPTLHHDSDATENSLEEFQSSEDETRQLQSARHITAEKSDSRQCYHSGEDCIHREEAERLKEEKIDSDVRSELQYVLYTAVFRDLVRKLDVQAYDVQKLKEEKDEIDIARKLQCEIYGSIFKDSVKKLAVLADVQKAMSMDFEAVTCGKLGTAALRRCCDLQIAEAEVDLLGDEVELLLGLLSKTYKSLDHYSPILQHYLGIRETLSMLGKELAQRHQKTAPILTAPRLRRHRSFSAPSPTPRVAMELDLPPQQVPQLTDLAAAIHRAKAAATALSTPSPSSHAAAAVAALRDAHAAIGSFLSRLDAAAALSCDDQPMAEGGQEPEEDGEGEHMVGEVEEGLRDCVLQGSKRRKRPVPPSWPLGRRTSGGCEAAEAAAAPVLDVEGRRRAAMDLLLQFHA